MGDKKKTPPEPPTDPPVLDGVFGKVEIIKTQIENTAPTKHNKTDKKPSMIRVAADSGNYDYENQWQGPGDHANW